MLLRATISLITIITVITTKKTLYLLLLYESHQDAHYLPNYPHIIIDQLSSVILVIIIYLFSLYQSCWNFLFSTHYFFFNIIFPSTTSKEASWKGTSIHPSLSLFNIYTSLPLYGQLWFSAPRSFQKTTLLCSHNMASSISQGLVFTTAMLVSTTVLYLAFSGQKTSPPFQIPRNSNSSHSNKQILRSCIYSGKFCYTSCYFFGSNIFLFYSLKHVTLLKTWIFLLLFIIIL